MWLSVFHTPNIQWWSRDRKHFHSEKGRIVIGLLWSDNYEISLGRPFEGPLLWEGNVGKADRNSPLLFMTHDPIVCGLFFFFFFKPWQIQPILTMVLRSYFPSSSPRASNFVHSCLVNYHVTVLPEDWHPSSHFPVWVTLPSPPATQSWKLVFLVLIPFLLYLLQPICRSCR